MKLTPALCCEVVQCLGVKYNDVLSSQWEDLPAPFGSDTTWLILASLYAWVWTGQWLLFRSCSILKNPRRFTVRALRSVPEDFSLSSSNFNCAWVVQYSMILSAAMPLQFFQGIDVLTLCCGYEMEMRFGFWGCTSPQSFHLVDVMLIYDNPTHTLQSCHHTQFRLFSLSYWIPKCLLFSRD